MKVEFKYYLHDNYEFPDTVDFLTEQLPEVDRSVIEKAAKSRPWYEVTLHCTLDTETGEVALVKAEL